MAKVVWMRTADRIHICRSRTYRSWIPFFGILVIGLIYVSMRVQFPPFQIAIFLIAVLLAFQFLEDEEECTITRREIRVKSTSAIASWCNGRWLHPYTRVYETPVSAVSVVEQPIRGMRTNAYFVVLELEDAITLPVLDNASNHSREYYSKIAIEISEFLGIECSESTTQKDKSKTE